MGLERVKKGSRDLWTAPYHLHEENDEEALEIGCNTGCVYQKVGDVNPDHRWCFKKGNLPSTCLIGNEPLPETRVDERSLNDTQRRALSDALGM